MKRWWPLALILLAGIGLGVLACRQRTPPNSASGDDDLPWFADVTEEVGLHFVHDPGPGEKYFFPSLTGSGAAFFDFDNDGLLDIYLIQNGGPDSGHTNRLFRQKPDGTFQDVSAGSGLDIAGYGQGVAIGDVNNDGWLDVLVTEYGRVRLFLNNGNGTFREVTKEAGLDNPLWATSAAFVDYDRDGRLDLVVCNYVELNPTLECKNTAGLRDFCDPKAYQPTVSRLFHNLGPGTGANKAAVRFEDTTVKAGLAQKPGKALGVLCADFDGDGWPDILIANDGMPNYLWINQRDGTFREEGIKRGIAYNAMGQPEGNMGIAIGDVDGDGLFDIFVTHITLESHRLWKQGPRGFFQDRTVAAQLTQSAARSTGFGTLLGDFDLDGALDLVLVNGRITKNPDSRQVNSAGGFWAAYRERNGLFANDGTGKFRSIGAANPGLCGTPTVARGLACGDFNNDGALDLLVTAVGEPARLYRNIAPRRGHWLLVRARDPALKRDDYGAEVSVRAGDKRWTRWLNPGYSYASSNDPRAHFGLGQVEKLDSVEVLWQDGVKERFPPPPVDRSVTLNKGEGERVR
jgi:hypothetical protein